VGPTVVGDPGQISAFGKQISVAVAWFAAIRLLLLTRTSFAPVHEAAASAPLRKVSTKGAKATAPRTKRLRLFSIIEVSLGSAVSPVADDKSTNFPESSNDSVDFMMQLPQFFSYPMLNFQILQARFALVSKPLFIATSSVIKRQHPRLNKPKSRSLIA
jgi:hypothetical protein